MKTKRVLIKRETLDSYSLILPLLLLLAVFILYPVIANIVLSFYKWKGLGAAVYIGLDNYKTLVKDDKFWISLKNTAILLCYIPIGLIIPVFLSAFLREGIKGWPFFRAMIYLPNILGYVIIGLIFSIILRKIGPLNTLLNYIHLGNYALDWLSKSFLAINAVGIVYGVWVKLGFGCIYFLAAMSSIDECLFDAAKIDGANWFQSFWNVTVPSIRFSIEFWIIFLFIETLARAFPFIYTFNRGGPGFGTFTLEYGIYDAAFVAYNMGYASTWASVLFVICAVLAFFQVRLMRGNTNV